MTALVRKITTAASTNLTKIKDGPANFKGFVANGSAGAMFVKLYWYTPTPTAPVPVVGTTVPDITLQIANTAGDHESFPDGITKAGELWVATTAAAVDTDSAVVAANNTVSIFYE